jgi:hypothetical protein
MKKLLLVLFILGITTTVFAELKPKQIVGKWKYTVETDQGEMTGTLKFEEKEGKLAGDVYSDDGGVFPMTIVELKENNTLYFELKPDYDVIKVTVNVENKKFKGTGSTNQGEFSLVGEKTE